MYSASPIYISGQQVATQAYVNAAIATLGGGVTSYLGAQMDGPKGYYPSSDVVTNVLQSSAPTAYSGQVIHAPLATPGRLHHDETNLVLAESHYWNNINGNPITGDNHVAGMTSYEREFWVSGADLTLELRNEPGTTAYGATDYLIMVDDMILAPSSGAGNVAVVWEGWNHTPESTAVRYHVLQFATSRVRRIRIFLGLLSLAGVRIPGASDLWPGPPRACVPFVCDSWGHGAFNSTEDDICGAVIPNQIAIYAGWEVPNLSQGGTGYNHPGAGGGTSKFGSTARLAALQDIVDNRGGVTACMVMGGGNDTNRTRATVLADANACWSGVKEIIGAAPLIVFGAQPGNLIAGIDSLNTDLIAAANANDDVDLVIDMYQPGEWITGTSGHLEDRDGNGSRDMFITNEALVDLHPGHAGHRNIGERAVRAMRGAA